MSTPSPLEERQRDILERRDVAALAELLSEHPEQATAEMLGWSDHPLGAAPLNFVSMLRCDNALGIWKDVAGTGPVARLLLDAGAPVDGNPGETETPLMTAASYGDAEVAQVLVDAGADLDAHASDDAGGVPGGSRCCTQRCSATPRASTCWSRRGHGSSTWCRRPPLATCRDGRWPRPTSRTGCVRW